MLASNPIRVLLLLEATEGGTARHVLDLVAHLPRDRYQVTALCSARRDPRFPEQLRRAAGGSVSLEWVPMVRSLSPYRDALAVRGIRRHLQQHPYHLLHAHSAKAGALGRLATLGLTPCPRRLYTPHAFPFLMPGSPLRRLAYRLLEKALVPLTDGYLATSSGEARHIRSLSPRAPLTLVPNGLDPSPYTHSPAARRRLRAAYGFAPEDVVVGCVGRLTAQKGQRYLLEALSRLPHEVPLRVMLVGDGPDRDALAAQARALGVLDRVVFCGHQPDAAPYYSTMDLYCLPSLYEGCPYTLLEAMAAALPCIATDVDGSREVVVPGRTGVLVPPAQAKALAEALARLVGDPAKRRTLGSAGCVRVGESFSLERMLAGTMQAYDWAVEARPCA